MKRLPNVLAILGALGLLIGLMVRLVQSAESGFRPAWLDPVFFWRGSVALLLLAITVILIQIRNK
jgi:hypothetical protein